MRQNILLAALSALTVATAQTQNFTINPDDVKPGDRADWCNAEYNTCRLLCGGSMKANACSPTTLDYTCTCSNGTAPGLEYYIQTIPTFICEHVYSECIAANTASSRKQDECKANIKSKCGTLDPTKAQIDSGSSDSSSSASSSATKAPAASQNQNAPASTSSTGGAAATNAALLGNGIAVVAAGVFAALL
ncbi:hypothetical protein BT67DRAFT_451063 [Trichocladium antarcticum]|uniref:DUF7707 domain-containing protein n=1 Tax=Trichocladium antarcticum TaxID=1450529 RepID=A0AAN6UFX2_9PEZI|nr:hypothetical protein BT67DRAFT_451063 [Trichocladium antarcticum]